MVTNYRTIRLEDRSCPDCDAAVDAVCKEEGHGEKYWFDCVSPSDDCAWGASTATFRSAGERVTHEEARDRFDSRYGAASTGD